MVERKVTVVNPTGLHLRPAGLLCQTSMKFDSKVMIFYKEKEIKAVVVKVNQELSLEEQVKEALRLLLK